ncbi:TPA: hypothetical protein NJ327_004472 [Vibrio parahaemolyticus]|nr:hypothetical protein [Vibrio parahaemolyticus]
MDMPMNRMELLIEIVKIENKAQQDIDNKELLSELGMLCFDGLCFLNQGTKSPTYDLNS